MTLISTVYDTFGFIKMIYWPLTQVEYLVKYGYLQETNSITHDYLRDGLR